MEETIINRVLDNDTRKKLMEAGAFGFTKNKEFPYVPESVREKDDNGKYKIDKKYWPVFKFKGKDGVESANMEKDLGYMQMVKENGKDVQNWISKSGTSRIKVLMDCVKGWKNYYDSEGNEIPFRHNNGMVNKDSIARIPSAWAIEFVNVIIERTVLSPEELEGLES